MADGVVGTSTPPAGQQKGAVATARPGSGIRGLGAEHVTRIAAAAVLVIARPSRIAYY
jgi:hypothetical protein